MVKAGIACGVQFVCLHSLIWFIMQSTNSDYAFTRDNVDQSLLPKTLTSAGVFQMTTT